jgi:hypothetical protein
MNWWTLSWGIGFLLSAFWIAAQLIDRLLTSHLSPGLGGHVMMLLAVSALAAFAIMRGMAERFSRNSLIHARIVLLGMFALLFLVEGLDASRYGKGDRGVLLVLAAVFIAAAATLARYRPRRDDDADESEDGS